MKPVSLKRYWRRWHPKAPAWAWVETLAITLVACGLAYWAEPKNPLFLDSPFPWLLLAPTLLALRYGALAGVFSMFVLLIAWYAGRQYGLAPEQLPKLYFLGGLILAVLCGEFSGNWRSRLRRQEEVSFYLDEHLKELTQYHYLLRLSHDRLEQNVISRPATLRDALAKLRELMLGRTNEPLPAAAEFLQFLSQYCQLEVAALYRVDQGRLQAAPLAALGNAGRLDSADPLVDHCLEKKVLSHLQVLQAEEKAVSRYLVAAPVMDSGDRVMALLTVHEMPFFALQQETLQMLAVLLGYYADSITQSRAATVVRGVVPDCPAPFADELAKLQRIWKEVHIPSAMVALRFGPSLNVRSLYERVREQRRSVDTVWELVGAEQAVLLTLMPLVGAAAVEGYLLRVQNWLREHVGMDFSEARITSHSALLGDENVEKTLQRLIASTRAGLPETAG
jgi:hypothetical protein